MEFYLVWAVVAGRIVPAVYFFYPETTGLSVEEIDKVFIDAPSILSVVSLADGRRTDKRADGMVGGLTERFDNEKTKEEYFEQVVADGRQVQVHHT